MCRSHLSNVTFLFSFLAALCLAQPIVVQAQQATDCKTVQTSGKNIGFIDCPSTNQPNASLRSVINKHANHLNLNPNQELRTISSQKSLHGQYTRLQAILDGYPVHNAIVHVYQTKTGHIRRLHGLNTPIKPPVRLKNSTAKQSIISLQQAEKIALDQLAKQAHGTVQLTIAEHAEKIWYAKADGNLVLTWKMTIRGDNPLGDFLIMIDTSNGEILLQRNRIKFFDQGRGRVFLSNPIQQSGILSLTDQNNTNSLLLNAQLTTVPLLGLDTPKNNTFLLTGQFVDVASLNSPAPPYSKYPDANQADRRYFYTRNDPRFEQVMAYYTIDSYQRYLRALGFSNDNVVPNGIHNTPIKVNVHWNEEDRSFYRPSDDIIAFGDGGVDDAEDTDIILHEYGHAIQQAQNPDWDCFSDTNCEMSAMGEAFADYIAADFHAGQGNKAYQSKQAACIGEWDSTSYTKTAPPCLRRVDRNKHYPTDIVSDNFYATSAIWSRALWEIRNALGSNIANQIILEHHYGLPTDTTMPMAAAEMLSVDEDLFGGRHDAALRKVFCLRGILTGQDCTPIRYKTLIKYASKDNFITQLDANANYGNHTRLKIGGLPSTETRTLIGFDLANIDVKKLRSAILVLTIARRDQHWGNYGHSIDIHPLATDFTEQTPKQIWWPSIKKFGVTWYCPNDSDLNNHNRNCKTAWAGGLAIGKKFGQRSSIPVVQTNTLTGKVHWTVTNDLKKGIHRWLLKKTFPETGYVDYYSKEGAARQQDATLGPKLILTFNK